MNTKKMIFNFVACLLISGELGASGGLYELEPKAVKVELLLSKLILEAGLDEGGERLDRLSLAAGDFSYEVKGFLLGGIDDPSLGGLRILSKSKNGEMEIANPDGFFIAFEYGECYSELDIEPRKMVCFEMSGIRSRKIECIRYDLFYDKGRSGWVKTMRRGRLPAQEQNFFSGSARPVEWW